LYGAKTASFHLDGVQSEVFVRHGVGYCVAFRCYDWARRVGVVVWNVVMLL
jgi:hypothetical protein